MFGTFRIDSLWIFDKESRCIIYERVRPPYFTYFNGIVLILRYSCSLIFVIADRRRFFCSLVPERFGLGPPWTLPPPSTFSIEDVSGVSIEEHYEAVGGPRKRKGDKGQRERMQKVFRPILEFHSGGTPEILYGWTIDRNAVQRDVDTILSFLDLHPQLDSLE